MLIMKKFHTYILLKMIKSNTLKLPRFHLKALQCFHVNYYFKRPVTDLFLCCLFVRVISFFNALLASLYRCYIILGVIRETCEILHWEDRGDQCWYQLCSVHKVYRSFGRGKESRRIAGINYTLSCRIEETKTFSRSSLHIQRKHTCCGYLIF